MTSAVFPGTFDPPTNGHLNIIDRGSKLFDKLDVVVAFNPNKSHLFSPEERLELLRELTKDYKNVTVHLWDKLIVEYAEKNNANILLRGIRNTNDFAYEFDLSLLNHSLDSKIETLFLPTEAKYGIVRSSSIKELAKFGGDISGMVPKIVEEAIKSKYKG
ncbi:pantetheine-phosphate adenylyltransferase [Treponema ruminis]|uniref:Phosphopantetheine adenylyltransferase n=1 Tax=Treponema ruminis TaxID=744515 RepID=A0A7W8G7E4_9SPIR|nr:pantetheine-phosphate adenylyltransferase [Treponema ruminis]MBB5225180.1 pantetheine-phosphate adenylyltransferase [Treponema ruminis]QSI01950.1 pantetheine-phosphate adenylyltransferase [Treponema ruminis]